MFLVEALFALAVIYSCTTFGLCFPWGVFQLQSDGSLSCDHGLDDASSCENNNNGGSSNLPVVAPAGNAAVEKPGGRNEHSR